MESKSYDFIIVGAGAAGLTAAQYAARSGLNALVLDAGFAGGQVAQIYSLENYPGVFPVVNGFDFADTLRKQTESFGAEIIQAAVTSIEKSADGTFMVKTASAEFAAPCLLLATGAVHRELGVKGEELLKGKGVSYCAACDGPFFRNKKVFVIGGGDTACSEALYLATLSDKVTVVHRRGQFRAQKSLALEVLSNKNISVIFNSTVEEIKGGDKVTSLLLKNTATGEVTEHEADGVFIFAGMKARTELFASVKKDEAGYIITDENMQTSVKNLFAAGDVRSKPYRQIVTACSDGACAAFASGEVIRRLKNESYR